MSILVWIILSTVTISLVALVGLIILYLKEKLLERILLQLVAYSAGALLGGAFFHLLPESLEKADQSSVFLFTLVGFVGFLAMEKFLHWRHCHKQRCSVHAFTYLNLIGDSIHNFIDGLIIAASFLISIPLGISTSIAIGLHEIPQEIGDYSVLVYGGFTRQKALFLNLLVALTVVLGGVVGYLIGEEALGSLNFLLPIAAGGFIYIAAADLLPEVNKESNGIKSIGNLVIFILGLLTLYLAKFI